MLKVQNEFLIDLKPNGLFTLILAHLDVLFPVSFPRLRNLQELASELDDYDFSSAEHRVVAITLDTANYRLFKPVRSDVPVDSPKNFMK